MIQSEFKKILFEAAFFVMACDGEIHVKEIAEIKEMAENSIYFDGINHKEEIDKHITIFKNKGEQALLDFFKKISDINFEAVEEEHLINVLVKIIEADEKVDDNEVQFLFNLRKNLKISDTEIIIKFPKYIGFLLDISNQEGDKVKPSLSSLDFRSIEDLFS